MTATHLLRETGRASRTSVCGLPGSNAELGTENPLDVTCPACKPVASKHPDLAALVTYPGNMADAVREAARMLDLEEHRYVERFIDCPNGCEYEPGGSMDVKRTAGPDDCDLCFLGSYEDENAEHINPLIAALTIAAASLEAVINAGLRAAEHRLDSILDWPEGGGQWRCICGGSGTTKARPAVDGHTEHAATKRP